MCEKKFYKIGYLSNLLGVTQRTIRYYDQLGLLPNVKRSEGGVRLFDDEDLRILKDIRAMQRQDFLPLEVIKKRLFQKEDSETVKTKVAIVTDRVVSFSPCQLYYSSIYPVDVSLFVGKKPLNNKKDMNALWKTSFKNKETLNFQSFESQLFYNAYLDLKDKGYDRIYSLHMGSTYASTYQSAFTAAAKMEGEIQVEVVDTGTFALGLAVFVEVLSKALQSGKRGQEIDSLIQQILPLVKQFGVIAQVPYFLQSLSEMQTVVQKKFLEELSSFYPVFSSSQDCLFRIECMDKSLDDAIQKVCEGVEKEYLNRKKYVSYIWVGYSFLYAEAQLLVNQMRQFIPQSKEITLIPLDSACSFDFGPRSLMVAIV